MTSQEEMVAGRGGVPVSVPDWRVYAGDTTARTITLTDTDGAPVDLTGWEEWRASWRPYPSSSTMVDLPVDASRVSEGVVVVSVPTEASAVGGGLRSGVWDMQARRGEVVRTWVRGRIVWEEDVTR